MYEFLLAVHVLAAVLWVGGGVTMHVFGRLATREGPERQLSFTRESIRIGNRLYAPLSVILLVAGILLVDEAGYDFSAFWVNVGFVGFLVSFVLGVGFYPRQGRRYEEIAAGEGPSSEAAAAVYRRVANVNAVEISILVLVVIDMAVKPG